MSETQSARILRRIGAILAGFFATVILSLGTDLLLYAAGVFPGYPIALAVLALPSVWAGGKLLGRQSRIS
jgi:hypothetical protein